MYLGILISTGFLYLFLLGIGNLNGNTSSKTPPPDWEEYKKKLNPKKPWTAKALRVELGWDLDKRILGIFRAAYLHHHVGQYKQAWELYQKLRSISFQDGSELNLEHHSEVFRHNWNLLKSYMNPESKI